MGCVVGVFWCAIAIAYSCAIGYTFGVLINAVVIGVVCFDTDAWVHRRR
jgi:hypothetical protein